MTKYQIYLLLHFSGILLVFLSYGSLIARAAFAGNVNRREGVIGRKAGAIFSGIGLLLILVSGFGLLALMQYGWPLWFFIKLCIWVALGAMVGLINKKPHLARLFWVITLLLGFAAVATIVIKPVT